jgi:Cof subfamily protein (haloacid dehalogenase superfamily)
MAGPMNIRLLAVDLDGTVMLPGDYIRPAVRDALSEARDQGIRVILATGRMVQSAERYVNDLNLGPGPVICYNGAGVAEVPGRRFWFLETLPDGAARAVVDRALVDDYLLQIYVGQEVWASREDARVRRYVESNHVAIWVRGPHDICHWPSPPIKILIQDRPERLAVLRRDLDALGLPGIRLVASQRDYLEVLPAEAGKGRALAKVAERLGIPRSAVAAAGDGENDADMLAWAGFGIAMGQGHPAAKAAADVVAPPVQEDGLAVAIRRYLLKPRPAALS